MFIFLLNPASIIEEENSEYATGVKQYAPISFDDELFNGSRHGFNGIGKRNGVTGSRHNEDRIVEGQPQSELDLNSETLRIETRDRDSKDSKIEGTRL